MVSTRPKYQPACSFFGLAAGVFACCPQDSSASSARVVMKICFMMLYLLFLFCRPVPPGPDAARRYFDGSQTYFPVLSM